MTVLLPPSTQTPITRLPFLQRGRRRKAAAAPLMSLIVRLALPGGTHYLGLVDEEGCRALPEDATLPPQAHVLLSDERDVRFSRATPISRGEARELAADAHPDVEHRLVFSADRCVVYARARDELPAQVQAAPLMLALEALDSPRQAGVFTLLLGEAATPDVVVMLGRDVDGALDADSLQVWLRPQDPVTALRRDFVERVFRGRDDDDPDAAVIHDHRDLLLATAQVPTYPQTGELFGRRPQQWASLALAPLALATVLTAGWAALQAWHAASADDQRRAAERLTLEAKTRIEQLAVTHPNLLARAAGMDAAALVAAARAVWLPGTTVRVDAREGAIVLLVRGAIDARTFEATALGLPAPPGYARGAVSLSADLSTWSVAYVSQPPRAAAAELLAR